MNIFYLDKNPQLCAEFHCDVHSVKMSCEYPQILSTAHRVLDGVPWTGRTSNGRKIKRYFLENELFNENLYKASHINHPSNIWVRENQANYYWLYRTWTFLLKEYEKRYKKTHASSKLISLLGNIPTALKDEPAKFTEPPPAMKHYPQCIVEGDSIRSYRNYYWEAKRSFSTWKFTKKPDWWDELEKNEKRISEYV